LLPTAGRTRTKARGPTPGIAALRRTLGAHWLDVVHYGESHVIKDKRGPMHALSRLLIRSLNNDMPYSRFVQEQLAGDVLFPDNAEGVVATGFIAAGPWDYVGHVELSESKTTA